MSLLLQALQKAAKNRETAGPDQESTTETAGTEVGAIRTCTGARASS